MGNSAKVPPSGAKTSATREPAGDGADGLEMERLALEREKLLLERQKTGIDARLRRRELSARRDKGWLETLASPLPLAIVGGFITLMTTIVTNFLTQTANLEAEQSRARLARESAQQQLQAELIKKFVESPKTETVSCPLFPSKRTFIRWGHSRTRNSPSRGSPAVLLPPHQVQWRDLDIEKARTPHAGSRIARHAGAASVNLPSPRLMQPRSVDQIASAYKHGRFNSSVMTR
jgi:hypothetical protein